MNLHVASLQGNPAAVRQHIEAGTDLNEKDAYGSTPLMIATAFDSLDVAQALIDAGADLHITNNDGGTPLHAAAVLCRVGIVEALPAVWRLAGLRQQQRVLERSPPRLG